MWALAGTSFAITRASRRTNVNCHVTPLTPEEKALWKEIRAKPPRREDGSGEQTIAVRLEKALLDRCTALAKKKRMSRDALIARGLNALLAAEGEGQTKTARLVTATGETSCVPFIPVPTC